MPFIYPLIVRPLIPLDEFPSLQSNRQGNLFKPRIESSPIIPDYNPFAIEKSNIMMLGPSGVGKTLMAKYGARDTIYQKGTPTDGLL